MAEFEAAYRERIVPILQRHGLVESPQRSRPVAEGIFCRLFAVDSPAEVVQKQAELGGDQAWQKVVGELGEIFGPAELGGKTQHSFQIYSAPAALGGVESIEYAKGYWRTFDTSSGLADNRTNYSILQDREGNLWFSTEGGASRYDGESFTNFTTQDGLAHNAVYSICQDREGYLWFGTYRGVSRYDGESFTTFTTRDGLAGDLATSIVQDRKGNLWFGSGLLGISAAGVSKFDGESFTTFTSQDGLPSDFVYGVYEDREGNLWFGTRGGVCRFDGTSFTNFSTQHDLAPTSVRCTYEDREGNFWFGCTVGGGVCRFDGTSFTNFSTQHGLANDVVMSNFQDREGYLWFSTYGGGVSRYDEENIENFSSGSPVTGMLQDQEKKLWISTLNYGITRIERLDAGEWKRVNFSIGEGLASNYVRCISQDRRGHIWAGTLDGYVSRYDGMSWHTFTSADGLSGSALFAIQKDGQGNLWFATQGGGVCRYDGRSFTTLTTEDGLAHNDIRSILLDQEGNIWFGTFGGGVCRCSSSETGELTWTTFTTEDGLGGNDLQEKAIFQDREGNIWFGTDGGGVSRYDGNSFVTFTTEDGLAHNTVWSITQSEEGNIWIGTSGGVNQYDGKVFQTLTQEDGLLSSSVWFLLHDQKDQIWTGTAKGVTRYSPPVSHPPSILIDAVIASRRYEEISELVVPYSTGLTIFEFHGVSFKTRPEAMVYRYRLRGYEEDWKNTSERRAEYQDLPIGDYTFEVIAVDRDLNYSEQPATVHLEVIPDPRDEQIDELEQRVRERTRQLEDTHRELQEAQTQLIDELEKELQTAHDMQMDLMPEAPPRIEGFDIAGRCIPANHVGGDFFQYFLQQDRLILTLADVTGHAMEAAIPVVMFSGILKSHMELEGTLQQRFERLNRSLYGTLDRRTAICFIMGELNLSTRTFLLADGGCPYPYHYRAASREVVELQVSAYPLGVRPNTEYPVMESQLRSGDRLIFCSDGIIEADDEAGAQFGFEKTADIIQGACSEGFSAEGIINQLLDEVASFKGDAPQSDDMTCVVVCAEEE